MTQLRSTNFWFEQFHVRRITRWAQWTLPRLAGLVLLVSAFMKVMAGSPPIWLRSIAGSWALIITAMTTAVETALGMVLLAGYGSRVIYRATGLLFGLFMVVALFLAIAGYHSCGCFGRLTVAPLSMGLIDASLSLFFLTTTPSLSLRRPRFAPWVACLLALCAAGALRIRAGYLGASNAASNDTSLVVTDDTIDLGRIPEALARKLTERFQVTNPTDHLVEIDRLESSCTCTSVTCTNKQLKPGQSIEITVDVSWSGRRGPQHADVAMTTKGTGGVHWLTVAAVIDAGWVASPSNINLGAVFPGQMIHQPITLVRTAAIATTANPLSIKDITSSTPAIRIISDNGGPSAAYIAEIDTGALPVGIGENTATVQFVPTAPDAVPAIVRFKYTRIARVEPVAKSLRFLPGDYREQAVLFDVSGDGVADKATFDVVTDNGPAEYAVQTVRHLSDDRRTTIEVSVKPVNDQHFANNGAASRLRCLVDGREASSVALVKF